MGIKGRPGKKQLFRKISAILIWSGNYEQLVQWYKEKLRLRIIEELDHPKDTGTLFKVGSVYLWIGKHSKVKGPNMDMHRHMFNLTVDSVSEAYEELKSRGVEFIADPFEAPVEPGTYFATFKDLDGNYLQLIGGK